MTGDKESQQYREKSAEYTISELAEAFDVTPRTIRYYEEVGLIAPRREGAQRIYSRRDRARLKLVLRGKRLGFSLHDIKEMLELYDIDPTERVQIRRVIEFGDDKLAEIDEMIADLEELKEEILGWRQRLAAKLEETN